MKVSLITVCYNSESTIERTIKSVLQQTYEDIEYLIIDGASNDRTVEIIRKYQSNIAFWMSEPDEGIYDAMNKGLNHASGDIIAFINSDDYYVDNMVISHVINYFNTEIVDAIVGRINSTINGRFFPEKMMLYDAEDIHIKMIYSHPAMFVRRELYNMVGKFDSKYQIVADYEWSLRAHNAGVKFLQVPDIFVNFSMDGISTIKAYEGYLESKEIALCNIVHDKEMYQQKICQYYSNAIEMKKYDFFYRKIWKEEKKYIFSLIDSSLDYYIWGAGYYGEMCYELFKELGIHIVGFIDNNSVEYQIHGYKVISPKNLNKQNMICIATPKYEHEIKRQLSNMNIDCQQYFSFSYLQKKVYEHGKQKYQFE